MIPFLSSSVSLVSSDVGTIPPRGTGFEVGLPWPVATVLEPLQAFLTSLLSLVIASHSPDLYLSTSSTSHFDGSLCYGTSGQYCLWVRTYITSLVRAWQFSARPSSSLPVLPSFPLLCTALSSSRMVTVTSAMVHDRPCQSPRTHCRSLDAGMGEES